MIVRWPALATAGGGLLLLYGLTVDRPVLDPVRVFGEIPIVNGGRVKPLDTLARNSLLVMSGRQSLRINARSLSATEWLMDAVFRPSVADEYRVFAIDDPDVLGSLGIQGGGRRRYSFAEIQSHLGELQQQVERAEGVRPENRSRFQRAVVGLWSQVILYWRLKNTLHWGDADGSLPGLSTQGQELEALEVAVKDSEAEKVRLAFRSRYETLAQRAEFLPLASSPESDEHWLSLGQALADRAAGGPLHPGVSGWVRMGDAYRAEDSQTFRQSLVNYRHWLATNTPRSLVRARRERVFNRYNPFYKSLTLYVVVCGLVFISYLWWPVAMRRLAWGVLLLAFLVHTGGILARIFLQGRPPVTNLYSSAIFVGWVSVLLGLVVERVFKNGLAALGAASIGWMTQIVALHLATQGDTMEMMRAVLDSNFWLATHVITVTAGYSSTFLSGALAAVYLVRRVVRRPLSEEAAQSLTRMVYGIVCFSTFFSFIGTVLGGIWADQSWGRFWGWDPKENGALMIVLWNALILHVWWGKMVARRGLMRLALLGNVITVLSWFGVNMLGIGLHSYGFMDKAAAWLMIFVGLHGLLMALEFLSPSE